MLTTPIRPIFVRIPVRRRGRPPMGQRAEIHVYLPLAVRDRLNARAVVENRSVSAIARMIIVGYLERMGSTSDAPAASCDNLINP